MSLESQYDRAPVNLVTGMWQVLVASGDIRSVLGNGYEFDLELSKSLFQQALQTPAEKRTPEETRAYVAACTHYIGLLES